MEPKKQVEEIVKILNPENPTSTDAVFLVQNYIQKTLERLADKEKQIALLEAELEQRSLMVHDANNEKLAAETRLKKEKDELAKEKDLPVVKQQKVGKGRTL